jgi:hypothetical protein
MNLCLFSTSGVHGSYMTIEEFEEEMILSSEITNEQTHPPQIGDKVIHFDGRKGVINRIVKILSLSIDKIGFFECHIKEV